MLKRLLGKGKGNQPPTYEEYPAGIRHELILATDYLPFGLQMAQKMQQVERALLDAIVERNLTGQELEKKGRVDQAITFYEQNVAIKALTPHPYNRLRIIYTKQKRYDEAIRVCQAYIDASQLIANAYDALGKDEQARHYRQPGEFDNWVEKLKAKQSA